MGDESGYVAETLLFDQLKGTRWDFAFQFMVYGLPFMLSYVTAMM